MLEFSPKQIEYINNANHRWNFKVGATRSGKTYLDLSFIIPYRIRERIGKEGLVVILGVTKETIERNVLEPMRNTFGADMVGTINNRNQCYLFGEQCYCLGAEKVNQVSKIRGASFKYVYGDEVAEWNKEVFELLKSRLDKAYSCFDGALNPESPTHWLKAFLDGNADIYAQYYTIFDNPYLPPEFVENLCKEYEGTIYYDRYILGLWKRAEGAIYRKFADNPKAFYCKIVDKIDEDIGVKQFLKSQIVEITVGIDFGGNKSGHAFIATAKLRGYSNIVVLKSQRHFGELEPTDLDKLIVAFIDEVIGQYGEVHTVYYDNAETVLGRGVTKAVNKKYPHIIVRGAIKAAINDRIKCTLRLMSLGRLWYTDTCDTIKDAWCDAVYDMNDKSLEDKRLDDGTSDIDSLDAFEYTIERDMAKLVNT